MGNHFLKKTPSRAGGSLDAQIGQMKTPMILVREGFSYRVYWVRGSHPTGKSVVLLLAKGLVGELILEKKSKKSRTCG